MKNKILAIGILAITMASAGNVYAVAQNSNSDLVNQEVQWQTETFNQGESDQIKTENNEQIQNGYGENMADSDVGNQTQQQTQQNLRDESGEGDQVQNQNQIKNKGEASQIQNKEQEVKQSQSESGLAVAEQRRSRVANAAQEMLQVADRNGGSGIGQQVRTIAQIQTQNHEKLEASLQKVQSRSRFVKFFIGPNYGEINRAKKTLEKNREQIEQLNQVKNQLANEGDQQTLNEQVQLFKQANLEIENLLNISQKGFSLFGWMFRLFSR
jgi:hypothetical protein